MPPTPPLAHTCASTLRSASALRPTNQRSGSRAGSNGELMRCVPSRPVPSSSDSITSAQKNRCLHPLTSHTVRLSALVNLYIQPLKGVFLPRHQTFTVQYQFFHTRQPLYPKLHTNYQLLGPHVTHTHTLFPLLFFHLCLSSLSASLPLHSPVFSPSLVCSALPVSALQPSPSLPRFLRQQRRRRRSASSAARPRSKGGLSSPSSGAGWSSSPTVASSLSPSPTTASVGAVMRRRGEVRPPGSGGDANNARGEIRRGGSSFDSCSSSGPQPSRYTTSAQRALKAEAVALLLSFPTRSVRSSSTPPPAVHRCSPSLLPRADQARTTAAGWWRGPARAASAPRSGRRRTTPRAPVAAELGRR
jgi:hypothetical protein